MATLSGPLRVRGRERERESEREREGEREGERERERSVAILAQVKQLAAATPASRSADGSQSNALDSEFPLRGRLAEQRLGFGVMGSWGDGRARPTCHQEGCGRRYYGESEDGLLCHVCDGAARNEWAQRMLCGSPEQDLFNVPLQDLFLDYPAVAKLCMEFVHGDGWQLQCRCTRCQRPWLDAGWVCPVEYLKRTYLHDLDRIFQSAGYSHDGLCYVDWDAAVQRIHDMHTDAVLLDEAALVEEFAEASARRARVARQWERIEHQRLTHLQELDLIFHTAGYSHGLGYVDWDAAVQLIHEMHAGEVLWDTAALVEFAEASARRVRGELREMYPDEDEHREVLPDEDEHVFF